MTSPHPSVCRFFVIHLCLDKPKAESKVLLEEVQNVRAASQIVNVSVEVFVEVYAHVCFFFF